MMLIVEMMLENNNMTSSKRNQINGKIYVARCSRIVHFFSYTMKK